LTTLKGSGIEMEGSFDTSTTSSPPQDLDNNSTIETVTETPKSVQIETVTTNSNLVSSSCSLDAEQLRAKVLKQYFKY